MRPAAARRLWGAVGVICLLIEAYTLIDPARGDTLSEAVWWVKEAYRAGFLLPWGVGIIAGHWFRPPGDALFGSRSYLLLAPLTAGLVLLDRLSPIGAGSHLILFGAGVTAGALLWRRRPDDLTATDEAGKVTKVTPAP